MRSHGQGHEGDNSHLIYSDDHGKTWNLGGTAGAQTNESAVAEIQDGSLVLNMRSYAGKGLRAISRSRDGGITWTEPEFDAVMIEPICQASLIRYGAKGNRLLFFFRIPQAISANGLLFG